MHFGINFRHDRIKYLQVTVFLVKQFCHVISLMFADFIRD
jgi:hypothetical protein